MTTITTSDHVILDSSGQPAEGRILFRQSTRFLTDDAVVTTTPGTVTVKRGRIEVPGTFDLPPTEEDEGVQVIELFTNRGEETRPVTYWVTVPDESSVEYADLPQITSPTAGPGVPSWAQGLLDALENLDTLNDPIVAGLVTDPGSATGAALNATFARKAEVNAADFGLLGDGSDETTKFQEFVNYLTANKKMGVLPASEYIISDSIDIPGAEGWGIRGMGRASTRILMTEDDLPIFRVGVGLETPSTAGCRMWEISGMEFRYQNNQSSSNTDAICILFVAMCYQFVLSDIFFYNGYYGQKTVPGQVVPWGATWDDIYFNKHMTGGAIDWTGVINNGPQNCFGRIFVEANAMVGPLFILRGHASTIASVEIIYALLGPKLFEFAASSRWSIGAIKLERATYEAAQVMIDALTLSHIQIGQLRVLSDFNDIDPASGEVYIVRAGAGGNGTVVKIGILEASGGANTNAYAFNGTRENSILLDDVALDDGWKLTKTATTQTAEAVSVGRYANRRISINKGDADYTVPLGAESTICFETALTAQRTVTLPHDSEIMTGDLDYTILSRGAVNGSNTLRVMSDDRVITTITSDNYSVRLKWRRNATGKNGWIVVEAGSRVAGVVQTGTTAPSSTPAAVGLEYIDTTAGVVYKAVGTSSSADWKALN